MSRNAIGIFQKVFAAAGDRSEITTFETDGYGSEYSVDQAPDRRGMNDVLAKVTAVATDINTYGILPWDSGLEYVLYATVLGADGIIYVSQQAANQGFDPTVTGNRPTYWMRLQEILSPQATDSLKGVAELATQNEVDARTDTQRIVTPATLREAPYYTVQCNATNNLETPGQFVDNIAQFSLLSRGSIYTGYNNVHWGERSFLCSMTLDVKINTEIIFKLFATDDYVFIYVDGILQTSSTNFASTTNPETLSFTLSAGARLLQIIYNNRGGGDHVLELMGDVIGPNVQFIGGI